MAAIARADRWTATSSTPRSNRRCEARFTGASAPLLERHYGAAASRHAAELAEHFRLGGNDAKALEYLAIACEVLYEAQLLTDALKPLRELERLLTLAGAEKKALGTHEWQLLLLTRQRLARVGLAIDSELADRYFMLERRTFLGKRSIAWQLAPTARPLGARDETARARARAQRARTATALVPACAPGELLHRDVLSFFDARAERLVRRSARCRRIDGGLHLRQRQPRQRTCPAL